MSSSSKSPPKQQPNNSAEQNNKQNVKYQGQEQELSEQDKAAYSKILKTIGKIDQKVQKAKDKITKDSADKPVNNAAFNEIAQKLIESKQSSQITNKPDLKADVKQSFEKAIVQVYSENQRLKKKMQEMERIIRQQNHKIFGYRDKEEKLNAQVQKLRFQLAKAKDDIKIANRSPIQGNLSQNRVDKGAVGQKSRLKSENQQNQDFDFWNTPHQQVGTYAKKKKEYVQNSALWVNQQQVSNNSGMFVTEGRR